ncbi:hypothetical protein HCU01_33910 [Halomonas cupida]|uniref:Predicted acyltransferase, LPLAT superfamily n=1 Tax=Halomonas cupida TaxID=44933 RepID=A0A1M7KE27_9GAMM|nr:glycosyl transferase [Halomonas cupida]GEN25442.1 hypothetical protein HCU01_33910 [Halomonas cupida]SHM63499.1 Predicted acyltransferase, LPLAT superfamily [Halomonas cupida]
MSRQHWASIGERGTLTGMLLMVHLRRLGEWPFRLVLGPVILWYYLSHGLARQASRDFLARLDPALRRRPIAWRLRSLRHFFSFGQALMDKVAAWNGKHAPEALNGTGVDNFRQTFANGRGGLVLVSHHGNLDVVNAFSEQHANLQLTVLMHTRNARKFNELLERATGRRQPDIMDVSELSPASAQQLDQRIRDGGFVVIAADRIAPSEQRYRLLKFLGAEAAFPEGPFMLATLLRCPIYTLSCVREHQGFTVAFEKFDDTSSLARAERGNWIAQAMQRHADLLADQVQRYPLQWFNFYPFWHVPEAN